MEMKMRGKHERRKKKKKSEEEKHFGAPLHMLNSEEEELGTVDYFLLSWVHMATKHKTSRIKIPSLRMILFDDF